MFSIPDESEDTNAFYFLQVIFCHDGKVYAAIKYPKAKCALTFAFEFEFQFS